MQGFIYYFRRTYLERPQSPTYAIEAWNLWDLCLPNRRTNNGCEGSHSALLKRMDLHPSLWQFIERLRELQAENTIKSAQLEAGQNFRRQHRRYRLINQNLFDRKAAFLQSDQKEEDLMHYLFHCRCAIAGDDDINFDED